jgi:SSS family solute:Na+ symporter
MNTTLLAFVILYLVGTMGIGIYAGTRIKDTADFAVAGRSLPLAMVITTTFATWFGAETVMGIPAKFVQGGLNAVIEDPFGASMCLVLVGAFFASRLYKMNLLTIGDFYRSRFGKGVEVFCSIVIILSYLGWVAAQITALGLVFSVLSGEQISPEWGMFIGTSLVLVYVLIVGLSLIAVMAGHQAGGAGKVLEMAQANDWFKILPAEHTAHSWIAFVGTAITMMLGSIPQQDVFQRVMSAKDAPTARRGAMIGGFSYLAFAFVPMFIVASSLLIMPEQTKTLLAGDSQKVLPTLILTHMPLVAQIFFFGALVSAIKSTSSATLLAPSTSFVENILRNLKPGMNDRQVLLSLRVTILVFTGLVLLYAVKMKGTPIYDMVSAAYQVTLVGAFVPLTFGLYWKRATTQGAILSIVAGIGTWAPFVVNSVFGDGTWNEAFPGQLAGLLAALAGMALGSLLPQLLPDVHGRKHHLDKPTLGA